jgi:6-pyruvoyltetrahydropterin/6-carboxytetrahydropterin synthase
LFTTLVYERGTEKLSDTAAPRYCRIEIAKHALNFSVAHFTIFSKTERENLHGHNFQVACDLTGPVSNDGLTFDYGIIKRVIRGLCDELDEQVILPDRSPYLEILEEDDYTIAVFNGERLPFLARDVTILPIANTTVEEFSNYLLHRMLDHPEFKDREIVQLTVKVSSSPGQTGCSTWALS